MKTVFKILAILIIVLIALALVLPIVFEGKITAFAKEEINKNVNATVDFSSINLSLIKSFPNFSLGIKDLTVTGKDQFSDVTLANIPEISVTLNLMSVISGSNYEVSKIIIQSPEINVKVLEDGSTNYDITVESEETVEGQTGDTGEDEFVLTLKQVRVTNASIIYDDAELGVYVTAFGVDHSLSGDLTADNTTLGTNTIINDLNVTYEEVNYLSHTHADYNADIDADLKNEIYTLKKNNLFLNELLIQFDGSVSMVNEDINIVMTFETPKTEFKEILSLVPAIYSSDFENVQASGEMGIDGHVKGIYNENSIPAFSVNLSVDDAEFSYPDLPQAVSNVNILTKVYSDGGDADNTVVDVSAFHMELGQNPIDANLLVKTPVSDPDMKGHIKGNLDLGTIKDLYPLEEGEDMKGTFLADVTLAGKLSDIENENYESFTALGSMLIKGFEYESSYTKDPVVISNAQLNFSPQYLDLTSLILKIGQNDISANGRVENYLAYSFKDEPLKGSFTTSSDYLNINDLMPESEETEELIETADADTTSLTVIEVPANIDFVMSASFNKLIYDSLVMENVGGKLIVEDQKLIMQNLSMNVLEGEMVVNGEYSTVEPEKPGFDFNLNINEIDIQKAYNTFGVISEYAPIAKKTAGKFSTKMNLKSGLDQNMMPVYETMIGGGELHSTRVTIKDVNTLNKIGDALKFEEIKRMVIDKILFQFEFVDGKILIEPFDLKHKDFNAQIGGWTGIDKSIDYVMNLNIPRDKFGNQANAVLENLVSQANAKGTNFSMGETVSMDVLIGGTLSDPEIKTALKETGKNLVEDVKNQVKEEIQKKKEEISEEARQKAQKILDEADKQAKNLIQEAERQAHNLNKNASEAAIKIRNEADKQAKKVEDEGKSKGFLAQAAAKETAKQLRKEGDNQANKVESEAEHKAIELVRKANNEASLIRNKAQKEADKILGR